MDEPPSKKSRADSDYDSGLDALSALESLEAFPTSSKDTDVDNNPSTSAGGSGGPSGSTPHPQGTPQPAPSNNGGFNLQPGQSQPQQPPQNMGGGVNGSVLQELLMNPSQTSNNSPRPQAYPPGQQNAFNRSPMMPNGTPNMMSPPSMGRVPGPSPGGPQPPGPGQPQMRPGQPGMFQGDQQQQMMMGAQGQQFPGMMHRYPYAQGGPPPGAQGMPQGYPGVSRGGPTPGQPMGRGAMMNGAMPRSGPMPTQGRPGIPPNQQAMMQPMMTDRQFMQHGQYGQQRPEFMQQYGRPGGYPMMHQGMMMDSNGQPIRGPNQMMMMSNGHPGMSHGPPNGQPGPQAAAAQHAAQQQAAAQAQAQAAAQQQQQQQREQEAAAAAQRNGAGRATTPGSSMLATHQDPEKRKLIQQQLVLLLHAHKCSQREKENRDFAAKNQPPPHAACTLPHCSTMKEVLTHMTSCNVGRLCHFAHCASSRQIIAHWKNCSREDCPVCKPLKRIQDTPLQFSLPDLANLIGVNGNSNGSAEGDGLHQFGSPAMRTGNITNSLFEGFNGNPFQNGPNRGGPRPPGGNGEIPNLPPPDMPDCTKEWHHQVTKDLRNHLVGKLVKAIFPEPNQEAMNDNRLKDLIAYARKVEKEMFESANDREEYYHLLAEKIYKIQKELQEKKNSRLNQGAAAHDQYAIPPSNELAQMLGVEGGRSDVHSEGSSMAVAPSQQNQPWGGAPNSNMHQQIPPNGQVPQVNNSSTFPSSGNSTPNIGASSTVSAMLQPKTEPMDDQNTDSLSSRPPTAIGFGGSSSSTPAPIMNGIVKKEEDPEESSNQAPPSVKDTKDGVAESKPKEQQAKREPTPPPTEDTVFSQEDLIKFLLPVWEKLDKSEDAAPFRVPVDAKLLNIPDYHEIIKRPMDLETVHKKLYAGQYQNAGQFCDDIWLMLDNAWLYNRKNSKVYKYGLKLSEMFVSEMDPVMKSMGYCCAKKLAFTPLSLFCYGAAMCTIAREQQYWVFEQSSTQYNVTVTERYTYCQKCFDALPPEGISLSENPNDRNNMAPKTSFTEQKNSVIDYEPFERCKYCMRKWHRICALHDKKVYPEGFICECCRTAKKYQKPDNKYLASKLPHNKLSTFLEDRVNGFIKKQLQAEAHKYPVIIRTLCVQDKEAEVKAQMKQKYVESNQFPEKFPYRTKAVFAFEIIDGVEVCFFGLHVQEYGSACPAPNARRVYIAYLDSVHFFQPRELRTDVYHELLLGYLDYAKMLGYTMAHIWACPPSEGDDYIFHCHPPEQKIPKPKRLQDWYKKMLEKGVQEGSVVEFKDIYKQARDDNLTTPTQLPYFEGDFWPNVIEDCIREASNEEAQRKVKEDDDDGEDADGGLGGGDSGKKKSSKNKKNNLKKNAKMNKKKAGSITGNEVADKLYSQFEKHKEVFFTIRLVSLQNEPAVLAKPISDPDGLMQSDMMDGRDTFLTKAREEHWEFSSLRRAKYSTLCLAYSLHETDSKGMEYTCNKCSSPAVWHCQSCDDFDLCDGCKPTTQHPHEMEKIKSLIGGGEAGDSAAGGTRYESIQRCIASLVHACQCRDANCRRMSCHKMKRVVQHTKMCKKRINGTCPVCKQLIALCCYHAKHCTRDACTVPFCMNIRQKLAEQKRSQQRRADMMMRRRMEGLQSHVGGAAPTPSTVSNGTPSNAPTPPVSAGPGPAVKGGGVGQVQMQQHQGSHVGGSGPAGMGQPMNSFGGMPGMGLGPNAQNGPGLPGMNPQMNANQSRYMPNGPGLGQSGAPGQQQQPMYSSGMPMQRPGGLGGMNPQQQPQQQQGHPGLQNPGGRPGGVHGMGQNQPVRNNQDMVMNMQMQNQHQQPPPFDSTLQPQIMKINSRLKAAKTEEERETVFSDLKKTPHLFHAWLRMRENQNLVPNRMQGYSQMSMGSSNLQNLQQQQLQQQQAGAMRGGGGFAPGQNNSQPRAPSGQFASMNPSMQQQYPQQQQGWPQQRQQNPGGMQQNANPYNQFQNRQNMMMMPQQQQPHPSNAGGQ
ncbi:Protein cbp-1 [Caenorhabditis elegans]|uniref:Isoform a of Protein cbp-1 n=2 Tax=Caenorhabditis elegans TaxID=6239 RepID=P34545-2|nr:Protein cbp-1 [Caenorhabditis elegans]CAA82353.3 Protein cbp-1 [Caenorhabditis elegans]|eukprot:NP_499161.2 Protein cbp-1 [Caenorhabditis elegans]